MFRSKAARKSKRSSFRLGLEALEARAMLAGNVFAQVSSGSLQLFGDAQANAVLIERTGASQLEISSLDGTTSINGSLEPVVLNGVTGGIFASLGGGDDHLRLAGTAETGFRVFGQVTLVTGSGDDLVEFSNFHAWRSLVVNTGDGNDEVVASADLVEGGTGGFGLRVGTDAIISLGSGNDELRLDDSILGRFFFADAGAGADLVDIRGSNFLGLPLILGGAGQDTFNNANNTFGLIPAISLLFEIKTSIDGPVAVDDSATVAEGGTVVIDVAGNDTSAGAALDLDSIVITDQPNNGSVVVNADGTITYTSSGAEVTSDVFSYTIADVDGNVSSEADVNLTVTPVNDAPVIAPVADVTTNVGVATGPIAVVLSDPDSSLAAVTLTATSSNSALVPSGNIAFSGTGAARTVVVTPVAGLSGTSTITLTATDSAGASSTETFVITVNAAPTISAVADQAVSEDTPLGPLAFTVGDDLTAAGALTVTATSSNPTLIPNANIQLSGSGSARTVLLTPAANATGISTITLTVTDANGATATETFVVTVNPVNDAPTISPIADASVTSNGTLGPISFTIGDAETAAGSLAVSAASSNTAVIQNSGIALGGSGNARTVTVTPVAGATGTSTITLTVTDGSGATATETFVVTVNAAPTISNVADLTIEEDTVAGPIEVSIGDAETAATALTFAATSSNQAVVQNSAITLGGSGSARTVLITPVANASGTTTITLTVTDGSGATVTDTFVLTVTPVNDPPVAVDDEFTVTENLFLTIDASGNVLSNDSDPEGGTLTITALSDGSVGTPYVSVFGTFTIQANGSFTYNLDEAAVDFLLAGDEIFDQIGYTVSDGTTIDNAVLTIRIRGVNG